jgi:hypothetical protein
MRAPAGDVERVFIDDPVAAPVLDLANALYNQLLRLLTQCYGRSAGVPGTQRLMLDTAIKLMHLFASVAGHLTTLPAGSAHPGVYAGVNFAMLRSMEPFAHGEGERAILAERLAELARGMRAAWRNPGMQAGAQTLEDPAQVFAPGGR